MRWDIAIPAGLVAVAALAVAVMGQGRSVIDTPHNLSATGTGTLRALGEEQVCIFCHTSHDASPVQPLWNRQMPASAYTVYMSSSLDAQPGQPTGASKMCLSCHDGTIALGSVVSRGQAIQIAGGITTIPPGQSNLGTDLSDDHPISFPYDVTLAARDPHLRQPAELPPEVRLDGARELQCTSCHDAHDNSFGDFLVLRNDDSGLCISCHRISDTAVPAHENCRTCHQAHSAPSGPYLLVEEKVTSTCLSCHDGSDPQAVSILADLGKLSVHDTDSPIDPPDAIPGHSTCADCHEPHSMGHGGAEAPFLHPNLGAVSGVSASGSPVIEATFEYEVCYKCHAEENAISTPIVARWIAQLNTRLEFDLSAVSYHPVQGPGRNSDVPSLLPGWNEGSVMHCSDCHGSDASRKAGGGGPNGVHGSQYAPLLLARYETVDFTPESASAYALCYRCHQRDGADGILSDRSFPHREHVVNERTPCSVCHDAHGISSAQGRLDANSHLINFDTTVVFPDPVFGLVEFEDTGMFSGSCTLSCHGEVHSNETYEGD